MLYSLSLNKILQNEGKCDKILSVEKTSPVIVSMKH